MKKAISIFALASALLMCGCAKEKISHEPKQVIDTVQQAQKIDSTLYTDKEVKNYQLPENFYMMDPNFIDSKDTLESMIKKADHDLGLLKWNYGYNDQYDFGIPKTDGLGADLPEDAVAFKQDKRGMQLIEFRQSLMERKSSIEREQIQSLENGYKPINFVDYSRAINSHQAVSDMQILQMAAKFQGFNIDKIFYREEDKSRIKVLHWNKEKALSVSEIEVDPLAFDNFLAVYNQFHAEKKQGVQGVLYIPFMQYQMMKNMSQQDMTAMQIFGRMDSELGVNEQKFLSVSNLKEKGVRVFSAGREQKAMQIDLPAGSMEIIQRYYDATKNL